MGEKLVIGPINKGIRTDREAFIIDNDSFPTLVNAYQWRGRVRRKRGTSNIGRLERDFDSTSPSYNSGSTTIVLDGSAQGNILTGFSLPANVSIVPGSVTINDLTNVNTYTDPAKDGNLVGVPIGIGTINYSTGAIVIAAGAVVNANFSYNPCLPVMGIEDLVLDDNAFPGTLAFDTTYSYNVLTASPYPNYSVSFYKNPSTASYAGFTRKTNSTPVSWNGKDYQQFYTCNYQGALWATNGVTNPFVATNIGMQFKLITNIVIITPTTATLTIATHGLSIGDFVFVNEVTGAMGSTINFQTGYVTTVTDANNVVVTFPNAAIAGAYGSAGIAQYLTNRSDTTKDCLRYYDGDPTNGSIFVPALTGTKGWVNFCPPISKSSFSIGGLPAAQYYLVGAKMIFPYKDRLIFFGAVVQQSGGAAIYLQDTILYSQNGTPYYTCSFTGDPSLPTTVFTPVLVPSNQTATASAYFSDQTGFGGFITAGIDQAITTLGLNNDALIIGFSENFQTRLLYTGNDLVPFNFYVIDSQYGSSSTFSVITMDDGVYTRGSRGFIVTTQTGVQRIDLDIPSEEFKINNISNGSERLCAQRDNINELVYFTFPSNEATYKFPTRTLQYNYRDSSWAIFNECYTTYGQFRKQTGFTWATVGLVYPTWAQWNASWDSGSSTLLEPIVMAGNQQGYLMIRDEGTGEDPSLYIQSISGSTITSPNHCLSEGDYFTITGCLGTISSQLNGKVFVVNAATTNTFIANPTTGTIGAGTYLGSGQITRLYVPYIQSKQFPVAWDMGRKTRIGSQQYLFSNTSAGQVTLLLFLSQDGSNPYNVGPIVPTAQSLNNSLIYSTVLYTCPESTNLGLTPANVNLNTPTAINQAQIWHRMNTSLIGDTVQFGFTLSAEQMSDPTLLIQTSEIEFHSAILDVSPSSLLC